MIHIRIDDAPLNSDRKFACGIGPDLPAGDIYFFQCEASAYRADCPGCVPHGPGQLGTPISQLATQPGCRGYAAWCAISESWGYG